MLMAIFSCENLSDPIFFTTDFPFRYIYGKKSQILLIFATLKKDHFCIFRPLAQIKINFQLVGSHMLQLTQPTTVQTVHRTVQESKGS